VQRSPHLAEAFRILADISRARECPFPTESTLVADLQQQSGEGSLEDVNRAQAIPGGHLDPTMKCTITALKTGRDTNRNVPFKLL
jgi:hypothetical protein